MEKGNYLEEFFHLLRIKKVLILSLIALSIITSIFFSFLIIKPTYEGLALLSVNENHNQYVTIPYEDLIISEDTAVQLKEKLNLQQSSKDILSKISMKLDWNSNTLTILGRDYERQDAVLLVNTISEIVRMKVNNLTQLETVAILKVAELSEIKRYPNVVLNVIVTVITVVLIIFGIVFMYDVCRRNNIDVHHLYKKQYSILKKRYFIRL